MKRQDKIIIDPFLQKILNERRNDTNMRGIMESVQYRQNEIIYADFEENLVVQGCAGSGKTIILFHRLANMEFSNDDFKISEVIFISPNEGFKNFITGFVRSLDIRNLSMLTFSEYIKNLGVCANANCLIRSNKAEDEIKLINKENQELNKNLFNIKRSFQKKNLESFLVSHGLPRRKNYETFVKNEKKENRDKYNSFIEELLKKDPSWNCLSKKLCCNKVKTDLLKKKIITRKKYKYIFIDEGQDYSIDDYILLQALNPDAVFNIFGDIKQKINKTGLNDWDELKQIFQCNKYFLSENYRNSREIIDYAKKRLGKDFPMVNMGPSLEEVREINIDEVVQYYIYERDIMRSRDIAFIADSDNSAAVLKKKLSEIDENVKNIFSVKAIKGMEFDVIFLFTDESKLFDNELYVAYTRGRNMLYIVKNS